MATLCCPLYPFLVLLAFVSAGETLEVSKRATKKLSQTAVISKMFRVYAKRDQPRLDAPTEVRLGIYINSFYSISEQTMEYSVNIYFRQNWWDPRLAFHPSKLEYETNAIKLDERESKRIWVPDTFFRNEKRAGYHYVTTPNRLIKVNATGHVWYVTKISATLACPMKLQKFPLDTQTCPIMFESFGYTMDIMYFSWLDKPVDIDPSVELPQFTLVDSILYDCSQNYTAGAFPCLEIRFVLQRDIGYFLIQVYVPSILIVILSWVAFWINIDSIPARVSLGLLTVLTMTTQSSSARTSLPRVSYVKAIDVWMSMCLMFVFTALLEFAFVNVISRQEVRTIKPVRRPPPIRKDDDPESQLDQLTGDKRDPKTAPKMVDPAAKLRAEALDIASRKGFPGCFLLFNIVYWVMYTLPTPPAFG